MLIYISMLKQITGKDIEQDDVSKRADKYTRRFNIANFIVLLVSGLMLGTALILWPLFRTKRGTISTVMAVY